MSLLGGCLAASCFVSVPLAYLRHPCPSPLWIAGMVLCRGQQGTSAGEETNDGGGGGSDGGGVQGWAGRRGVGRRKRRQEEREGGRRQEGRKPKVRRHRRAGVVGLGDGLQSLGLHQLLSGGGSLCTLFFFILSRYSCWDTASTDARISSSSQSFRPKAEGDIC